MTDLRYDLWQQATRDHSHAQPTLQRADPGRDAAAPGMVRAAHGAATGTARPRFDPHMAAQAVDPATRAARMQGVVNWAGALISIALIVGVALWGYRLMVRDVSGVPVVRALEGPMRVAPDVAGGRQAAYRGLAVNAVAAGGGAAPAPDEVMLAPPTVGLDTPLPSAAQDTVASSPAAMRGPVPDATPAAATVAPAPVAAGGGLARSPVPRARPAGDLVAEAAASAAVATLTGSNASPTGIREVQADSLAPGTRLVQLGAYDSAESARAEWERMATRFGPLMTGRARVVQEAESGGRAFWRLRAHGFSDEADARQFCAAILPEHSTCIPVLVR